MIKVNHLVEKAIEFQIKIKKDHSILLDINFCIKTMLDQSYLYELSELNKALNSILKLAENVSGK